MSTPERPLPLLPHPFSDWSVDLAELPFEFAVERGASLQAHPPGSVASVALDGASRRNTRPRRLHPPRSHNTGGPSSYVPLAA